MKSDTKLVDLAAAAEKIGLRLSTDRRGRLEVPEEVQGMPEFADDDYLAHRVREEIGVDLAKVHPDARGTAESFAEQVLALKDGIAELGTQLDELLFNLRVDEARVSRELAAVERKIKEMREGF